MQVSERDDALRLEAIDRPAPLWAILTSVALAAFFLWHGIWSSDATFANDHWRFGVSRTGSVRVSAWALRLNSLTFASALAIGAAVGIFGRLRPGSCVVEVRPGLVRYARRGLGAAERSWSGMCLPGFAAVQQGKGQSRETVLHVVPNAGPGLLVGTLDGSEPADLLVRLNRGGPAPALPPMTVRHQLILALLLAGAVAAVIGPHILAELR